ncbi:MAG: sugar-binding protein, partial [Acidobacteriota bacterium]
MRSMATRCAPCFLLLFAGITWLAGSPTQANNGALASAYPIENVEIDGQLGDWGDGHSAYLIERFPPENAPEAADFRATFRVAYGLQEQALYVAVEVMDDIDFRHPGEEPEWGEQDSHLLYVDKQHLPRGSGGVLYMAGHGLRDIVSPLDAWDPANTGASWDDAQVAIGRHGQTTVYEWRIQLGDQLVPNKTIGLDHLLSDRDAADENNTLVLWGEGFGKSTRTWRLGDVLLLERGTPLGRLEGTVRWQRESEAARIRQVRITSLDQSRLWVQAPVDAEGHYEVELPVGRYRIASPYRLTNPFGQGDSLPRRIDETVTVDATVGTEGSSVAEPLVLPTYDRPDYLFRQQGAFAGFDASRVPEIDAFVEAFRRYYEVPGVSVALVHDGKLA